MKTRAWFIGITGLIILLIVSACTGSTPAQTTEAAPSNSEASSSSSSSEAGDDSSSADAASVEDDSSGSQAASSDSSAEEDTGLVSDESIKIGFLTPTSSIAAQSAQDMIDGFNLFWEQHGLEVAGRSVEIFIEDTAGDPDQALAKARLLVEQREVDILYGTVFANVGLAVADYMKGTDTPFLVFAGADDLTQRNRAPNVIRAVNFASSAPHHVFGEWVANNTDCQSIYTIGSDYAFGHEVVGGFVNTFTDNGGTVQEQVWNPITEADFSSYLAAIQDAQPDCVFALEVGAGAIRFITAWNDFGLKDAIPLYLGEVPVDQSILRGIDPPELAEGLMSVGHYAEGLDNPATQAFVEAYDERYGSLPSFYSVNAFTSAQWMVEAIEAVNGDLTNKDAFLDAVRSIELDNSPLGPVRLDKYGNPIQDMYIRRVEIRDDGRLWNAIVDVVPEVSQFYKYDPEEYLQQPVYSRDYQGINWPAPGSAEAAADTSSESGQPVSDEPIKIGFLTPTSSIVAQSAQDMINGFNLFWEQNGLEVAGRPLEIFIEDTAGDPDQALAKARLLVEQREVDILYGTVFANVGLAVAEYMKGNDIPFLVFAGADDLTQRGRIPNVIRAVNFASSAPHHAFGEWVANNTDCQSVYTIGSDYAFGHEVVGGFVNTFTDNGGTVQEQVWNPIPEADFSSYLAAIVDAQPDCVFALEVGAAAIRFITAWSDFGLKDEIPLYMGEVPTDQSILRGIDPPDPVLGQITVGHYAEGWDNPATQAFVETYDERYGDIPSFYSVNAFVSAQWMAEAIEAVNGNLSNRAAFLDAVKAIELDDSPLGPVKLDDYGNPIQTMFIRQVEMRDDGRLWNVVIEEIPNVSQFYNYDPEEYLQQPVYSRDYQGINWP